MANVLHQIRAATLSFQIDEGTEKEGRKYAKQISYAALDLQSWMAMSAAGSRPAN